jgi:hypothetical protein
MDIVQSMFMGMAKGAASRQAMAAVAAATIRTWHSLPPAASAEPSASLGDDLFDRDVAARVAAIEKVLRAQLLAGPISHEDVVLRNVAVHCHCEGKPFGDLSMVEARRRGYLVFCPICLLCVGVLCVGGCGCVCVCCVRAARHQRLLG